MQSSRPLFWFTVVLSLMVGCQIVRLRQDDPAAWLITDYSMRVAALGLLAISPVRSAVFCFERLRISRWHLLCWIAGAIAAALLISELKRHLWGVLPDLLFGQYPRATDWVRRLDLTFGLALVALHEELIFRRFARLAFARLGDGFVMVIATSLAFGLFHWWTGLPNILASVLAGAVLMLLYRRAGVLWPAVFVHYIADAYAFG